MADREGNFISIDDNVLKLTDATITLPSRLSDIKPLIERFSKDTCVEYRISDSGKRTLSWDDPILGKCYASCYR